MRYWQLVLEVLASCRRCVVSDVLKELCLWVGKRTGLDLLAVILQPTNDMYVEVDSTHDGVSLDRAH